MSISHVAMRDNGAAVPAAMLPYRQFVVWRLVQRPGRPKPDKVPFNPNTGALASVDDPATWGDYATARAALDTGGYAGIGFVFTAADPFAFVDLDDSADLDTGTWKPHALAIMATLPGAWEISQSGKGLHGVGYVSDKATLANKRRKFSDANGNRCECYTAGRFMAIGGAGWTGEPSPDWTEALCRWLPDGEALSDFPAVDWRDEARPDYDGPANDDDLIRRALASKGTLGHFGAATFAQLWEADATALGNLWPDDGGQGRSFDHSAADLALANALAWWTGCNPIRMERLFNRSALARGDQRKTRLAIAKAIADPNRRYFSRAQRLRDDQRIGDDVAFGVLPKIVTLVTRNCSPYH